MLPDGLAATYRWVGDDGKVHYGDTVPAQNLQGPYQKLDKWGRVEEQFEGPLTDEQRAAERRRREELDAQRELAHRQQVRDRLLLETYSDPSQLGAERDQSLAAIDAQIILIETELQRLTRRNDDLLSQAAAAKQGERPGLEDEMQNLSRQIDQQRALLAQRRQEREAVAARYAADMARLEQLRSAGSASPHPRQ